MASSADDEWSVDGVGVHAGLVIVVHRDKSPVCDYTSDADSVRVRRGGSRARDQIFHRGGVEKLDVGEREYAGKEGGSEEGL